MSHQLRQAGRASVHNGHAARPRQQSASVPPLRLRGGTGGVGSQAVNAGGGSRGGATQGTQFIKVSQPAPVASAAAAAPYHHQYLPAPATTAATATATAATAGGAAGVGGHGPGTHGHRHGQHHVPSPRPRDPHAPGIVSAEKQIRPAVTAGYHAPSQPQAAPYIPPPGYASAAGVQWPGAVGGAGAGVGPGAGSMGRHGYSSEPLVYRQPRSGAVPSPSSYHPTPMGQYVVVLGGDLVPRPGVNNTARVLVCLCVRRRHLCRRVAFWLCGCV